MSSVLRSVIAAAAMLASGSARADEVWSITELTTSFNNGAVGGPSSTWTGNWTFPIFKPGLNGGLTAIGNATMTSQRTGEVVTYPVSVELFKQAEGNYRVAVIRNCCGAPGPSCLYLSSLSGDDITQSVRQCSDGGSGGSWSGKITKRSFVLPQMGQGEVADPANLKKNLDAKQLEKP